jgi:hypothetical protein
VLRPIIERSREDIGWMEDRLGEPLDERDDEQPDDVRSEAELMQPSRQTIERLRQMFDVIPRFDLQTPEGIAQLIHRIAMQSDAKSPSASRASLSATG